MSALFVDDRYRGAHGIGRYAREVLTRLRPEWAPLGLDGSPHAPLDAFRPLDPEVREGVVYSPGYGALVRARRQVLTVHDLIQLRTPWPGRLKFSAYYAGPVRRAVRRAGVVLTVSETSARDIRAWVSDDDVRVVNAGNGCSAAFTPGGGPVRDDPYIAFVGNLRPHKNLDVLLRALALAPDVRIRAVLPEREVAAAAAAAAEAGVDARVDWLHDVDDERLAELYRGASALAMPSMDEGFGLPALEAVSCGVPVVFWSGCAAVAEIVGDRGSAVGSARAAAEWADALDAAVRAGRRVTPPVGAYNWDRTAATVSDVLEQTRER